LLAKIDFIAFSVRFRDIVLKSVGLQIFLNLADILLLWQRKSLKTGLVCVGYITLVLSV